MMQKKNVYITPWIKGAASEAAGGLMTPLMVDKAPTGLPIIEQKYSRESLIRTFKNLQRDLSLLTELMPSLEINEERMLTRAGEYWAQVTDLAGALVQERNLPRRTVHQIVGIHVRLTAEREIHPHQVTPALLDEASEPYMGALVEVDSEVIARALDPTVCVEEKLLLAGELPSAMNPPSGCRFHTRCPLAMEAYSQVEPQLAPEAPDHSVACHLIHPVR